ncbi:MAG: 50S ribosomal protein L35 [Armatimonadota bacterium]
MPKVKTNKTAAKRFKITGSGKIMFDSNRLNHLMMNKKDGGRVRRMKAEKSIETTGEIARVKRLLPNSF